MGGGAEPLLRAGLDGAPTDPSDGREAASGFSSRGDFWDEGVRSWGGGGGFWAEAGGGGREGGGGGWAEDGEGSAFSRPSGLEEISGKINRGWRA